MTSATDGRSVAWRQTVQGMTLGEVIKASYRKFIFRRVEMGLWEIRAGDAPPPADLGFDFALVPVHDVDLVGLGNPNLNAQDLVELRENPEARCVIARRGEEIAGSTWALRGRATVHELQQVMDLGQEGHLLTRTFVSETFRGRSLQGAMLNFYASRIDPDDTMYSLTFDWNEPSIRNKQRNGWRRTATRRVLWVFGIRFSRMAKSAEGKFL